MVEAPLSMLSVSVLINLQVSKSSDVRQ
jgi:hypothetical protein